MIRDRRPEAGRRTGRTVRAVQSALRRTFGETNHRHFRYGLNVRSASPDLRHIDVAIGHLGGETYCCGTLSCSVPYYERSWWRLLRKNLEREGLDPPAGPITLHVAVITEAGALFPVLRESAPAGFSFYEMRLDESGATW